jgi:pimeloyl-ACP methyl ester carboxylesterase
VRLQWNGQSIDVREAGAGPSIVLLHGYPLDGAMWSGVARTLAAKFRVVKPDLPGRGENPAPASGDIESYADFLETLVRELPSPVGLAGFSMGGYVSLALLRRGEGNVRAIALVDTRAEADDDEGRKRRDEAIATVREAGVAKIADAMVPKLLSEASLGNRDLVDRLRRILLRQKPETVEADLSAMRDRKDSTDLLARISIPALVLVGENDALTPPALSEKMAAAIPGARLVRIPGAGHLAPMERPGAVAAALGDFFTAALTV